MRRKILIAIVFIFVVGGAVFYFLFKDSGYRVPPPIPVGANKKLAEHNAIFKKGIEQVTDNVYVAIGYGLSNSIMIEGDDGLIIVDTMTTMEEAETVLAEFRKISSKPIKAVIYTHNHADHILGAQAFTAEDRPEVYAHDTTLYYVLRILTEMRPIVGTRALRMFGGLLDAKGLVNAGIGPFLGVKPESRTGFVPPTRTFADTLEDEVAGIRFKLIHVPGETNDQICVWLPDQKLLIPGDNFYWTFPNLYTIRGTPFRSLKHWYQSLDKMRDLRPEHLVPCHTRPIKGAEKIHRILTDYRDAIQFVHDQSIRGINMGLTPDELAEFVRLPPHLAEAPYLQPFYGTVAWSVRSMFAGNLGWFDGDSANLQPLSKKAEARLIARLAGGEEKLLKQAEQMLKERGFQAALQLTGYLLQLRPEDEKVRDIRVQALTARAEYEQNPNARHYYLTEAMEIRDGFVAREQTKPMAKTLHDFPLMSYLESLAVNLDPRTAAEINQKVGFVFPDAGEAFTVHLRFGVAEIRARRPEDLNASDLDIKVSADSRVFKEMLGGLRNPIITIAGFDYEKGGAVSFGRFMRYFQPADMKLPCTPLSQ